MPLIPFILIYVYAIPLLMGLLVRDIILVVLSGIGVTMNIGYMAFICNVYNEKALILATNITDTIVVKVLPICILSYIIYNAAIHLFG